MNQWLKIALCWVSLTSLQAHEGWQWGVTAGLGGLSGAEPTGVRSAMSLVGVQARGAFGAHHVLQGTLTSRLAKGEGRQTMSLQDGASYEAEAQVSTSVTWVSLGLAYHHYVSGKPGSGWHPFAGAGLARVSQWKAMASSFDLPEQMETASSRPFGTLGVGYDFSHRWSLSLEITGTQAPLLGTQVDPRRPTLRAETGLRMHTALTASFWF